MKTCISVDYFDTTAVYRQKSVREGVSESTYVCVSSFFVFRYEHL